MSSGAGQLRLVRAGELPLRDLPLLEHELEDVVATEPRVARIRGRVVEGRVGGDAREERRVGKRQLARALLEVGVRRLLDPVRAVPEVDRVQVRGEDPVLAPALLELPRERGLADLARERPLVADVCVLDELLRDRRATLDDALLPHVLPQRSSDPVDVDPVVLEEPLVLHRDDRLTHDRRDVVRPDEHAALVTAEDGEDALPVRGVDDAVDLGVLGGRVERRDLARDRPHEAERERDRGGDEEDEQQRREPTLANPAPSTRRPLLLPNPQERGF